MGTAKVILADTMPKTPAIPRSTDGMAGIRSPPRPLAEQAVSPIMDVGAVLSCSNGLDGGNGYGRGGLETCMGTLGLKIPKPRTGRFFPWDVTGRHCCNEGPAHAVIALLRDFSYIVLYSRCVIWTSHLGSSKRYQL
mgnify:CR=1 FL=1